MRPRVVKERVNNKVNISAWAGVSLRTPALGEISRERWGSYLTPAYVFQLFLNLSYVSRSSAMVRLYRSCR